MPTYADNKKARFDYDILETIEAGLVLSGQEVKSIRGGHISLKGGFVTFHGNDAYIINVHIPKYRFASAIHGYNPESSRKLLLKKKEIQYLRGKTAEQGLTIVPLAVYASGPLLKMKIGLAKGKKKWDKRESIKKKEMKREMQRKIKK